MYPDFTLENFGKVFGNELYVKILLRTLLNALITTGLALVLGYPVAFAIARGRPWVSRLLVIAVISPLLVGIVPHLRVDGPAQPPGLAQSTLVGDGPH